ncbi:uncharacterized protein LOC106064736 isoform X2 [Biomphalaria glabrata]|uniref:Uncharacterized protein LOC106064736 isoform X2 n=1 Tax=Biomphalaria glabrata TaxID=6526 RepID=A0A9W2YVM7_BIOGL|nr:uncharacterized protein LOC106064736 isoform X2 [Biomphalaria glabrata]
MYINMNLRIHIFLIILKYFKYLETINIQCQIGEERKNASILIQWNQTQSQRDFFVLYKVNKFNHEIETVHCDLIDLCGTLSNQFGSVSAHFHTIDTVVVTFNIVSREHEGEWRVKLKSLTKMTLNDSCHFTTFARPDDVRCTFESHKTDNLTKVTCSAVRIYPKHRCAIYHYTIGNDSLELQRISYIHVKHEGEPVYYTSTCTLYFDYSSFPMPEYNFTVTMYPDVTMTENDQRLGKNKSLTLLKDNEDEKYLGRDINTESSTGLSFLITL